MTRSTASSTSPRCTTKLCRAYPTITGTGFGCDDSGNFVSTTGRQGAGPPIGEGCDSATFFFSTSRIATSDVSKIAGPFSKMRQCANDSRR